MTNAGGGNWFESKAKPRLGTTRAGFLQSCVCSNQRESLASRAWSALHATGQEGACHTALMSLLRQDGDARDRLADRFFSTSRGAGWLSPAAIRARKVLEMSRQ